MDTDLFQILALILLLGLLLTLFGVLQSLGAIRKTLEGRGAPEPAAQPATTTPAGARDDEPETWARPSETERVASEGGIESWGAGARTGWPAPQEAAAETAAPADDEPASTVSDASAAPAASGASGSRVLYGDSGLTAATPSEAALRPDTVESGAGTTAAASAGAAGSEVAETSAGGGTTGTTSGTTGVGAGTTDTTAGTAGAGAVTERAGSAAEDPQEQPFERDGRWWFRRGDELLVYEEQTGQWVPAEQPSTSGSVAAAAAPETIESAAEPAAGAPEGQVTTQQETVGSFWKCPSCGAVNGSTATSCRMCFTARP